MILRTLKPTDPIPWHLGLVCADPVRRVMYAAPVPLNIPMRFAWLLWNWAVFPFKNNLVDMRIERLKKMNEQCDAMQRELDAKG